MDGDGDASIVCDRGAIEAGPYRTLDLTVTTTDDQADLNPGDGVCSTVSSTCSLRAAIQESNEGVGPRDIELGSAQTYTLTLNGSSEDAGATGDLDVRAPMRMHGHGSTIARTMTDRALHVQTGGALLIESTAFSSSPIQVDIRASAQLWDLTLTGTTVSAWGPLDVRRTSVSSSGIGTSANALIVESSFSGSSCLSASGTGKVVTVQRSTFLGCTTPISVAGSRLTLENSTIGESGTSTGGAVGVSIGGQLDVVSSTLTANLGMPFRIAQGSTGTITVTSSIVAMQQNGAVDCFSPIVSGGYNLFSSASCSGAVASDLLGANPQLAAVGNNGGLTLTYLPDVGSPAIDSSAPSVCLPTDQRGTVRPQGAACDRGAVEQ